MPQNKLKFPSSLALTAFLTLGLSLSFQSLLAAWVSPDNNPPISNVSEPLYKDADFQNRLQQLWITSDNAISSETLRLINTHASQDSFRVDDTAGDTTPFVIDNDGNVGINNQNPAYTLDVSGSANVDNDMEIGGDLDVAGSIHAGYIPGDNLGDHAATKNIDLNGHWLSGDGDDEGLFIDNSGQIGIGKINPGSPLDIINTSRDLITIESNNQYGAGLMFRNTHADTGGDYFGLEWGGSDASNRSDRFTFWFAGPDTGYDRDILVLESGGNVGINKQDPQYTLDVAGNVNFDNYLYVGQDIRSSDDIYADDNISADGYILADEYIEADEYIRADGGFQVDGESVINSNGSVHTARYNNTSRYGYFEVRDSSGDRGAYFGYGNGDDTVNLYLDDANRLYINSGYVEINNSIEANTFYDHGDTSYYVNPAGNSYLSRVYADSDMRAPTYYDRDNTSYYANPSGNSYFNRVYADSDMRAPTYYDRDNTSYYANPSGTSKLNALTINSISGVEISCTNVSDTCSSCTQTSVNCGSGYTATGGGCYFNEIQNQKITSKPLSNGWSCIGDDVTTVTAYARCCKIQ